MKEISIPTCPSGVEQMKNSNPSLQQEPVDNGKKIVGRYTGANVAVSQISSFMPLHVKYHMGRVFETRYAPITESNDDTADSPTNSSSPEQSTHVQRTSTLTSFPIKDPASTAEDGMKRRVVSFTFEENATTPKSSRRESRATADSLRNPPVLGPMKRSGTTKTQETGQIEGVRLQRNPTATSLEPTSCESQRNSACASPRPAPSSPSSSIHSANSLSSRGESKTPGHAKFNSHKNGVSSGKSSPPFSPKRSMPLKSPPRTSVPSPLKSPSKSPCKSPASAKVPEPTPSQSPDTTRGGSKRTNRRSSVMAVTDETHRIPSKENRPRKSQTLTGVPQKSSLRHCGHTKEDETVQICVLSFEESIYLLQRVSNVFTLYGAEMDESSTVDIWFSKFAKAHPGGSKSFLRRYLVYEELKSAGWAIRSGMKFGVDYLLYEAAHKDANCDSSLEEQVKQVESIHRQHAKYGVLVIDKKVTDWE
eukprot:GHVN01063998.1.p1 GENE.GHVN01063998.1~~GHVN01063998.1.p1  ORF type:complete len:477 (-),score=49.98 GHVN01063998.1:577-2007(-)